MQNKGLVRLFAIILSVVCLYQLSFTWFAKNVEKEAAIYAETAATTSDAEEIDRLEKYVQEIHSVDHGPGFLRK